MQVAGRIDKEQVHAGIQVPTLKELQMIPEDNHCDAGEQGVQTHTCCLGSGGGGCARGPTTVEEAGVGSRGT